MAGVVVLAFASMAFDRAVVSALAAAVLVVLAAIDVERGIIPNRIVLPAAALVLLLNIAIAPGRAAEWTLAALLSALVLAVPALLGRNWMGMGDAKLALLMGAALGSSVVGALLIGFLSTFPVALFVLARDGLAARKATIPFGPFLVAGALIVMFGPHIFT